jgi:hypothetical protein
MLPQTLGKETKSELRIWTGNVVRRRELFE